MGDEAKLKQLKNRFLQDLEKEAASSCVDLQVQFMKCINESMFNRCWNLKVKFQDCAKERFEQLKTENKDILEFQIDPENRGES